MKKLFRMIPSLKTSRNRQFFTEIESLHFLNIQIRIFAKI